MLINHFIDISCCCHGHISGSMRVDQYDSSIGAGGNCKQTTVTRGAFLFSFYKWRCNFLEAYLFICLFILNVIPYVVSGDKRNSVTRTNSRKCFNDVGANLMRLVASVERTDCLTFLFSDDVLFLSLCSCFLLCFHSFVEIVWTSSSKECVVRTIFTSVTVICLIVKL